MLEIDGYRIDCEVESDHTRRAEVTLHPVEDGVEIADHVLLTPLELSVRGIVSATPIGAVAGLRSDDPVGEALIKLEEVYEARAPVTVRTSVDEYDDMLMQELTIPASVRVGDAVEFTARFVQVERVTNERTTVPVSLPIASARSRQGVKRGKASGGTRFDATTGEQFDQDPIGANLDDQAALRSTRAQTDKAQGTDDLSDVWIATSRL
jgi:hypothetical protein